MIEVYNLLSKMEFLENVAILEYEEWADNKEENKEKRISKKIEKLKRQLKEHNFCKLILLDNNKLIGFISIFPDDCEERKDLFPWYATMYVKEEYRGNGYSRILNDAILQEAKRRNIKRLYLKTKLNNYYEKFGAKYMDRLKDGEKLYYFDI